VSLLKRAWMWALGAAAAVGAAVALEKDKAPSAPTQPPPKPSRPGTPAPAARQALRDATRVWPGRNTDGDGILPSPAHLQQSPNSDHNTGDAVDITVDKRFPGMGDAIASAAINDPRTKNTIWNRRQWTPAAGWMPYYGKNPHTGHVHISLVVARRDDVRPWDFKRS
jgi:protein-disulfide isomerase